MGQAKVIPFLMNNFCNPVHSNPYTKIRKDWINLYYYKEELINIITPDKPDPEAARVLQEILGGHYGEMRTMMQYFFQSSNFRGKDTQYRDLLRGVFLEEIAHVELVQNTINQLLNDSGASAIPGNAGVDNAPLDDATRHANPHHFIIGAQASLPVRCCWEPLEWLMGLFTWKSYS